MNVKKCLLQKVSLSDLIMKFRPRFAFVHQLNYLMTDFYVTWFLCLFYLCVLVFFMFKYLLIFDKNSIINKDCKHTSKKG